MGAAIRAGIRASDDAAARRADLLGALRELLGRIRSSGRGRRDAEQTATDQEQQDLQDRTGRRRRSSEAVQQIADQYPTTDEQEGDMGTTRCGVCTNPVRPVPAGAEAGLNHTPDGPVRYGPHQHSEPKGSSLPNTRPDAVTIPTTELQTLDQFLAEIRAAIAQAEQAMDAWQPVRFWALGISERYAGAKDLPKTLRTDSSLSSLDDTDFGGATYNIRVTKEKLQWLESAVLAEQNRLKEVGGVSGRLENVSS